MHEGLADAELEAELPQLQQGRGAANTSVFLLHVLHGLVTALVAAVVTVGFDKIASTGCSDAATRRSTTADVSASARLRGTRITMSFAGVSVFALGFLAPEWSRTASRHGWGWCQQTFGGR